MGCLVLLLGTLLATCHVDQLIAPSTAEIRLTVAAVNVGIADTARLVAIVSVDGKQNRALRVQWTTSAVDTATVDSSGVVRGIRRGMATITARVENELFLPAPLTASAAIRVVVPRILLAPSDTAFTSVGDTICLRATAFDATGATLPGLTPVYSVTIDPDSTVVPVGPAGCFRARRSGTTATVRAVLDTAQKTATLPVRPVAVSLNVTPDSVRFNSLTAQRSLTAAAVDGRGNSITSPTLVWTSLDTIVTVSATGVVRALANGATWVRAADTAGTARDSTRVFVQQVAATIAVSPGSATLQTVRARATLAATVRDSLSQLIGAASPVWTSLAPGSVRVVSYGGASATVEAVAEGSATIAAQDTVGGQILTATAPITVRYQLTSLSVSPSTTTLSAIGDTVRFTASGRDVNDSLVSQPRVDWSATDTTRIRIDSTGLATARDSGTTNVTARRDAVTGTATASVNPPVLVVSDVSVFSDSALRSSTDTGSTTRVISNGGTGTDPLGVRLSVLHGATWLQVAPDTVTVASGGSISIRLTTAPGSLAEGTYRDTVRLRSGSAVGSPRYIPVRFTIYCPVDTIAPDIVRAASLAATDCGARHQAGSFADYYAFTAATGDPIRVAMSTSPTSLDTYLYLLDSAGAPLASNDNCPGAGLNSCLQFVVTAGGQYTIEATSFTAGAAFAYTLSLTRPRAPTAATALGQFAGGTPIPAGDSANTSTIEFRATAQDPNPRDTLRLQVEVRPTSQAFQDVATVTGAPAPNAGGGVILSATVSGLANFTDYHWHARTCDQTNRCSAWLSFPQPTPNPETAADFKVAITTPVLTVTPTTVSDAAPFGTAAPRQTSITIQNTGTGTFTWSAVSDTAWLTLAPSSGSPGATPTLSLNPVGLAAGTHRGTVTITAPGAVGSPATITVTFEIQQPVLVVNRDSVTRSTNAGSGATFFDTLRIVNGGNGSLSWTASHNPAKTWLSFSRTAGGAPDSIPLTINSSGLTAGNYRDTVVVTASGATGSPAAIPVTLIVHQPILVVNPTSIRDSANVGSTAARTHVLHVTNADGGTMTWTATKTRPWVTLVRAGDSVVVTLQPDTLSGVLHTDTVRFTSPEANNDPVNVPVVFDILQPVLSVTPGTIADSAIQGETAPRVRALSVANTGRGRLAWSALDDTTWISVSPAGDTIPGSLTVTLTPTGLAVGTHTGKVVVTSLNATGSPRTIPVTFTIKQPPLLSVSPTSYTDSAFQGSALAKSVVLHIANTGPGALTWSAVKDTTWLALSRSSGGAPPTDSTIVTLTPGSLAAGTHNGTVTVTAPGAAGSPATIPVNFKIKPCAEPAVIPDTVVAGSLTLSDCGAPLRAGSVAKLYSVNANAGDTLSFRLTSAFDAYLVLTNSLGGSLRQNDECTPEVGTGCIKNYPVTVTGRYVVEATTAVAGATGAFTLSVVRERAPGLPQSIGQFKGDSTTAIGTGLTTDQNVAVFKGTLNDPNPRDSVRLEIEMVLAASPFSGNSTHQSGYVAVGQTVWIRVPALAENAGYHWKARTCDKTLRCSGWLDYGGNPVTAADFFVNAILETPAVPTDTGQFLSNGSTPISLGGTAGSGSATVVLKGLVTDPDPGDLISLEVEVKATTTAGPDGTGLRRGTGVATNGTASVMVPGLTGAIITGTNYYWRARACDQTGLCSAWVNFGNNKNTSGGLLDAAGTDFRVTP
jgi:hypothetical protein